MKKESLDKKGNFFKENVSLFFTIAVGIIIWFCPRPEALTEQGWHLLAIFIATIVGVFIRPLPMGAVAIMGITAAALTNTLTIADALSSYSNPAIWIIVLAFFISRSFVITQLGLRIAYLIVRTFGKSSLGIAYSLTLSELILAPVIPSITARTGGIMLPIVNGLAQALDSKPNHPSAKKLGSFLILVSFQGSVITSAMFITAMAANPIVVSLASGLNINITWGSWALAAVVPGIANLVLLPLVVYKLSPPTLKKFSHAQDLAKKQLKEMGKLSSQEKVLLVVFILMVTLWGCGHLINVASTTTALLGVSILLITRTLTWKNILEEKSAWDAFIWFSALLTLANQLAKLGVITYFSQLAAQGVQGIPWPYAFAVISLLYFYSHYFFVSSIAHVSAMYAALVSVSILFGTPPMLAALLLAFFSSIYGGLTHYGIGSAPVLFGVGYVSLKKWWTVGLLVSFVNIAIWGGLGSVWWHFLGLW